jgi:capsular exopolysaccharide synthesis family protein
MDRISPQMLGFASGSATLFTGSAGGDALAIQRQPPLRRMQKLLLRWRWVLIASVMAGALLAILYSLLATRQYTAVARIEIARETARVVNIDSVERDTSFADQEFYQTQYGLLQTKALAERVARDLHVVDDPAFFRMFGRKSDYDNAGAGGSEEQRRDKRTEAAGKILLDHVDVAPVRGSSLVDVTAVTPDPDLSQRIAQTWIQDFITSNLERRYEASSYARHFLETRLAQLRDKLETSERQVVGYAANQGIINLPASGDDKDGGSSGSRSLVTDDLTALNNALDVAVAERIQAGARLSDASHPGTSSEALNNEAIGAMREKRAEAAGEYSKLLTQFQPDYPQAKALAAQVRTLDASIAQEENRVRASLRDSYTAAVAREKELLAHVKGLKGDLVDLRRRNIQYNIYQRDADTTRELYNALLQRYKEIGIAGGIENNNITIADAAKRPDRPSSPRLLVNMILGILAGAALGGAIALVLEQFDEGIADPSEIEEKLGIPLLGSVPRLEDEEPLDALNDPRSQLVEAYLAIQANLKLSTAHGTPKSLAVISTRPEEGKSTTTIALARSLARNGRKVILIDADLRSPSIHRAFGLSNIHGVSNFLSGGDDLKEALQATDHPHLTIMTAGPQPPNAADLLTGERLSLLIDRLLERFDHVLVDSPPVIGLADAPLVAAAVEAVIYAIEARTIQLGTVRIGLGRLRTAHANILGAVLTKFEARRAHFGYGYDYGYGYGRRSGS